jgi:hypothetical protein
MTADDLVIVDLADEAETLRARAELADAYRAEATEAVERLGQTMRELEQAYRIISRLREALTREKVAA